jgi:peptidyl-prolyl cis-trans isomerase B (cyclophilin B)
VRPTKAAIGLIGPMAAIVVLAGCTTTVTGFPVAGAAPTTAQLPVSAGPCKYTSTPSQPAPAGKAFGLPDDPNPTPKTGTVTVTLQTTQGDIPLTLDRAQAPCTVQSFLFLARKTYFDRTPCHRLTSDPSLKVLQCGDPTGTSQGGPGYTIPDENPNNLTPAPITTPVPAGEVAPDIYPAGTVAMANTGQPNSGGSQFFLVYGDSQLPPTYAVFGTVTAAGLSTLAKIAAGGLVPGTDPQSGQPTPTDGKPKLPVTITKATVAAS